MACGCAKRNSPNGTVKALVALRYDGTKGSMTLIGPSGKPYFLIGRATMLQAEPEDVQALFDALGGSLVRI